MIGLSQTKTADTASRGMFACVTVPFWGRGLVMRLNNMNDGRRCQVDPTHSQKLYLSHPVHPPDVIHVIKV